MEGFVLRALLKAYKKREIPDLPVPFVYVLAEPGFGVWYSHRLVSKIINSLWKHRYLPVESRLSVYNPQLSKKKSSYLWKHRQRGMMLFLVSDSVRRYSISFRKWLTSQAAAFMVVNTSFGVAESYKETFNDETTNGYQICPGPTFTIYLRSARDRAQNLECMQKIGDCQFDIADVDRIAALLAKI